ncbi:MAG: glucosamine-6-phosphate deaminase [Bryobacteraceae bacterium]
MPPQAELRKFACGKSQVSVYPSRTLLGLYAARKAAEITQAAIEKRGRARIIVATGNSQVDFITALVGHSEVSWSRVELFHMDEYVGLPAQHPASFRFWIQTRVEKKFPLAAANYIHGDAPDVDAEIARYSSLLAAAPIDCAFVGFGENGHIAFNDPPSADFDDPVAMKVVVLDEACRRQQVGEGHFKDVDSVPRTAITITCSGLFRANAWICCVPERRKAAAVRDALTGPISTSCPASLVRRHPAAWAFLDEDSSSLLDTRDSGS